MSPRDTPLVSVIVPFYNIERFVEPCLKSILGQTFQDYEIVCVDDGSTDRTGALLDSYRANLRVRVFHKENGGLSSARNYGISVARGEYLSFVDGDDFVSPYYLESLVCAVEDSSNAMAVGQFAIIDEGRIGTGYKWDKPIASKQITRKDLLRCYMYESILPGAVSRLARREIYQDTPFPDGRYYEEIATAAEHARAVDCIAFVETPIYAYVMRRGSIVHGSHIKLKQITDYSDSLDDFIRAATDAFDESKVEVRYFLSLHRSRIFRLLMNVNGIGENQKKSAMKDIVSYVRGNLATVMIDNHIPLANKIRLLILASAPSMYCGCFRLYERCRLRKRS